MSVGQKISQLLPQYREDAVFTFVHAFLGKADHSGGLALGHFLKEQHPDYFAAT